MTDNHWKEYIKFCVKLMGYCVYQVSRLLPRSRSKWCFDSLQDFGNTWFLFIDIVENHKDIRAISITQDKSYRDLRRKGFEAYHWLSLKGIYHCMTAGAYIVTINTRQINPYLSGGALYVNLWHGNGLKACVWNSDKSAITMFGKNLEQIASSRYCRISLFYTYFRKPDLALSTSPFLTAKLFAPQYRIACDRFIETNFPRNAVFSWTKERIFDFISRYESPQTLELVRDIIPRYSKTYIYMPTWRDSGSDIFSRSGMDFERLNELLKRNNELFLLKLHPLMKLDHDDMSRYENISVIEQYSDAYTVLPFTDMLITDYSSVYYDYLQLNREMIVFCFDLDEYLSENRELMFDYEEFMPGRRAESFDELLTLLADHTDCHVPERERIMHLFWESYDNGMDIAEEIKTRLSRNYVK